MGFSESALGRSTFVLERRVNRPSDAVARVLRDRLTVAPAGGFGLGNEGTLLVEEVPRRSPASSAGQESWRTTGKLLTGRGRLVSRLDIEVSEWAPGSVVIQLRPLAGRTQRWGTRRTRRYFTLAHAGADQLERLLNETASAGASGGHPPELSDVTIRPIEPYDIERLRGLFWRLSPQSRYFRFLSPVTRPAEACLHHLTEVDHHNRDALVASVGDQIVGVARYDRDKTDPRHAEVAVVVEDAWHRHGVATALLHELTGIATERGVEHFTATVAADNGAVARLVKSLRVRANWNWEAGQRNLDVDLRLLGA
jgi:RimJ/RimL family protein N-acetyltransferase